MLTYRTQKHISYAPKEFRPTLTHAHFKNSYVYHICTGTHAYTSDILRPQIDTQAQMRTADTHSTPTHGHMHVTPDSCTHIYTTNTKWDTRYPALWSLLYDAGALALGSTGPKVPAEKKLQECWPKLNSQLPLPLLTDQGQHPSVSGPEVSWGLLTSPLRGLSSSCSTGEGQGPSAFSRAWEMKSMSD